MALVRTRIRAGVGTALAVLVAVVVGVALAVPLAGSAEAEGSEGGTASGAAAETASGDTGIAERIASGLRGVVGAAIGPDGALYVAEATVGRIARVDIVDGSVTSYAIGLPAAGIGSRGVVDVAFLGRTAYALILGSDGRGQVNRITTTRSSAWVADLGVIATGDILAPDRWSAPPPVVQSSRGALLVTDPHHQRILRVTRNGNASEYRAAGELTPTGLDASATSVYVAEVGPGWTGATLGTVTSVGLAPDTARSVATGPVTLLDVELGRCGTVYAISAGDRGRHPPDPARPPFGELLRVDGDGVLTALVGGFAGPRVLEIVDDTALVITRPGEVWRVSDLSDLASGSRDDLDLCRANIRRDDARAS